MSSIRVVTDNRMEDPLEEVCVLPFIKSQWWRYADFVTNTASRCMYLIEMRQQGSLKLSTRVPVEIHSPSAFNVCNS